jgi:putative ABC transport system substrate-binding protein
MLVSLLRKIELPGNVQSYREWALSVAGQPAATMDTCPVMLVPEARVTGEKTEYRSADGNYDRLPALAQDLVGRKVDLIVTIGGTPTALAAKKATSTIPIVFGSVSDPVAAGLVASLARPGGNITGVADLSAELMPKQFEVLIELVPRAKVIALLVNPANPPVAEPLIKTMPGVANSKGLDLSILKAASDDEIDAAFASLAQQHVGALVVQSEAFFYSRREQLVALASRHAVPAIYDAREFPEAGGLLSYGPSSAALNREFDIYVGEVLNGAKPADLPIYQPTRFELVINLKTAKALGLTVPQSLLARADEVIE